MVPFLLVGVARAVRDLAPEHPRAVFLVVGGAVGILWSAVAMLTTPLLVQEFRNPLSRFCAARLVEGVTSPTMAGTVIPLVVAILGAVAFLVAGAGRRVGLALLMIAFLLAGQAALPEPPETRLARRIQQAELLIRMGQPDAARAALAALDGVR
jgi:hypothetical protein